MESILTPNHFDGSPRVATYWFIPPGGAWDRNDNGIYTFELQPGAVRNTIGNSSAAAQQLGTFTVNIPPPPSDSDGDGLRNAWELTYWPTIVGHDADDDFDHDGFTEIEELGFGLNPTVASVAGAPQVVRENGYLTVSITKRPGAAYEVQSAGALLGGLPDVLSTAQTVVLIDNATTLKVRDDVLVGTPPARFLRVKVLAAP